MSDTTAVPVTPAAPAALAADTAPAVPELSAQDVVRGLSAPDPVEAVPVAAPVEPAAPVVDATGRAHDAETGQFVAAEVNGVAAEAADVAGEPAAEIAPGDAPASDGEAATPEVPAGFVRIELSENHFLRDRGRDHILAPEGMEEDYRSLVNNPVRHAEVKEAREYAGQLEEALVRHQAALRALNEFNAVIFRDPRVIDTYRGIEADQGRDAATLWLNGLLTEHSQGIDQYVQEAQAARAARQAEIVSQQHAEAANTFLEAAFEQAPQVYPHWSPQEFQSALSAYASFAKASNAPALSVEEFRQYADALYIRHPKVQAQVQAFVNQRTQAEAERIANERAAQVREQAAKAAALAAENPMGGIPSALGTRQAAPVSSGESASAAELLRGLRIA
jgi:hypothetical protein